MLRRNGPVIKSVERVLRPEGGLRWERFVEKVGFEPGVKERELWMVRVVSWQRKKMWQEHEQASQRQNWNEADGEN